MAPMGTTQSELDRARSLIFAAKEVAAKDVLLAIGEQIEEGDRELVAQWISAHIESTRKLTRGRPF